MSESAETLRERRRLKILNQSGERMKKLLGAESSQENVLSDSTSNDSITETCSPTRQPAFSHSENKPSTDPLNSGLHSHLPLSSDRKQDAVGTTANGKMPDVSSRLLVSVGNEVDSDNTSAPGKDQADYWLMRKVLLMFLGVLVRLLLISKVGQWATQTIFNPFMTIEIIIFGYERLVGTEWHEHVSGGLGGMWLTVFHLTGVNKDIIQLYRRVVASLGCVLTDFTFYFFAFVVVHLCI